MNKFEVNYLNKNGVVKNCIISADDEKSALVECWMNNSDCDKPISAFLIS